MVNHPWPRLCVFVKAPGPGRVKTRLAARIGARGALEVYTALVECLLERLGPLELPVELWVDGETDNDLVRDWSRRYALRVREQPRGDLGRKMLGAIRSCCDAGHPGIVIGSDLPEVGAAYVNAAASLLSGHDLVLGPTEDGGYALVGANAPVEELFTGIDWGGSKVYAQTMEKIDRLGLSVAELPETWDVDTLEDWRRLNRES